MKICTVNVPEAYIEAINKLIGADGLYPSRSELIRVAVRQFILRELQLAKVSYPAPLPSPTPIATFDEENFVRVPTTTREENGDTVREFKTYRILQRLD